MYCIISSSPISSSSSIELGAGEGVEGVRRLEGVSWRVLPTDAALEPRALESDIFGLSNLRPLDGERTENWRDVDSLDAAGVDKEAIEPVDGLRPVNDIESRFFFMLRLLGSDVEADGCFGKREKPNGEILKDDW
jgi:hypothetical protein